MFRIVSYVSSTISHGITQEVTISVEDPSICLVPAKEEKNIASRSRRCVNGVDGESVPVSLAKMFEKLGTCAARPTFISQQHILSSSSHLSTVAFQEWFISGLWICNMMGIFFLL